MYRELTFLQKKSKTEADLAIVGKWNQVSVWREAVNFILPCEV
jgi:hypothetical protein